jgi:cell division protein FtsI (penicillin-binding protein 3)
MDARTGAVLALVSLPDFDPNNRPNPTDPEVPRTARCSTASPRACIEQGSTFKPLFAALAWTAGSVGPETLIDAKGPLHWGRFRIRDSHRMPPEMTLSRPSRKAPTSPPRGWRSKWARPARPFSSALGMTEPTALEIAEARLGQPLLPRALVRHRADHHPASAMALR